MGNTILDQLLSQGTSAASYLNWSKFNLPYFEMLFFFYIKKEDEGVKQKVVLKNNDKNARTTRRISHYSWRKRSDKLNIFLNILEG